MKTFTPFFLFLSIVLSVQASDIGKRFLPEKYTLIDQTTGIPITVLTKSETNDVKLYQTHPQWTSDGQYIIFRSFNRSADKHEQAFAVSERTGIIIQLTDGKGNNTASLNVARKSNKIYYFRTEGNDYNLIELNLDLLFTDSEQNLVKDRKIYERTIVTLPKNLAESGGFTLDADEKTAYVGVVRLDDALPQTDKNYSFWNVPSGIRAIDLQSGKISTVIDVPFRMGHVQANPFISGEILYCHETGGDAPQRMWITSADGSNNRALFVESPTHWITHETWVDKDHVYFNVMGNTPALRKQATGIFRINVRTDEVFSLGQVNYGAGFWHCNGTSDGKWAVGDNFEGEVYLINCKTGEKTLLTANHVMKPDHTHPTFSPDNTRILIQSGYVANGKYLDLMVINIPDHLKY
ncbi:oligogalacturonate lyase family protein [Bacteroides oleiciplenus]|uniref:Oligogalacturonate lyase domain-containing protein n=1 Tax=Bacteroides oleiciplenus TaxID=626931 RepID=A0A3E5BRK4_9BACE|nr:oligogalacturonate lyase family protein [Bacteroides oleiciplenus]RGN40252.1 hypothetical protein DXB65_01015 [Bacteroides oleiciplenus]